MVTMLFSFVFICFCCGTYLSFLLVEVIDDDTDEEIEGEEGAEDDEDDEVQVHVQIDLLDRLLLHLTATHTDNLKKEYTSYSILR